MWICLLSSKFFEDTFENAHWRKAKQMRSVPLWFNHLFRHPFLCGEVKRNFKSWTSVTNVNMPALIQVLWGHIWECTVEKSQTNATRTPFIQSSCQTSFPLCREVKRDFNAGQVDRQDGTDLHSKVRIISHPIGLFVPSDICLFVSSDICLFVSSDICSGRICLFVRWPSVKSPTIVLLLRGDTSFRYSVKTKKLQKHSGTGGTV